MGQSKVGKPRYSLAIFIGFIVFVLVGAPLTPLVLGLEFRNGTGTAGKVRKHGAAQISSCDTRFYGLVYKCDATVRWSEGALDPVREVVYAAQELRGEHNVQERVTPSQTRGGRTSVDVVPVGYPWGTTAGGFILPAASLLDGLVAAAAAWWAAARLRKPPLEAPPENADLRATQVSRDKVRRRRRKNNR
nr:hypothetical protein [Kibdelosporangium sp. MJ126-NF4]